MKDKLLNIETSSVLWYIFNNQLSGEEKKSHLYFQSWVISVVLLASAHLVSSYKSDVPNFKVGNIGT